jgi:hypothetical protein
MKTASLVFGVIAVCLVGPGCKKGPPPSPPETIQLYGVAVDLPKLDTEFQHASPEVQATVLQVKTAYRYGQLSRMMEELDKLGNTPGLTDAQKKLVSNLTEQMKQVIAKANLPAVR